MITIYCIEDINDLKYVGSTGQKLNRRFSKHKSNKRIGQGTCSSRKLNLENSIIYPLEECNETDRTEREKYWINKLECVNVRKLNGTDLDNKREKTRVWQHNNRDKCREHRKRAQIKLRERLKLKK